MERRWLQRFSISVSPLTEQEQTEIRRGKVFVQLKNGPFDLDLIFAADGIERSWSRRVEVAGFMVCAIDDNINSKRAAHRENDRESLARLESFRDYLQQRPR